MQSNEFWQGRLGLLQRDVKTGRGLAVLAGRRLACQQPAWRSVKEEGQDRQNGGVRHKLYGGQDTPEDK